LCPTWDFRRGRITTRNIFSILNLSTYKCIVLPEFLIYLFILSIFKWHSQQRLSMVMPDLQWYPQKLCLIKYEQCIYLFLKTVYFLLWFICKIYLLIFVLRLDKLSEFDTFKINKVFSSIFYQIKISRVHFSSLSHYIWGFST